MSAKKHNNKKKSKKDDELKSKPKPKPKLKEKVADALELPKEVVLNIPKITILGNKNMVIENYKGIIEYDFNRIRVNTTLGIIKICGEGLVIKEITSEDIMVYGEIKMFEILG